MYALTVLDHSALAVFRSEHPWLEFPDAILEVCIYFDDNGGPTRLTALEVEQRWQGHACRRRHRFGVDTVLSLIRYAPQGAAKHEESPEERHIWALLEELPVADGSRPARRCRSRACNGVAGSL
ncbi:MAG: hypothetical protein U5N27_16420 [Rhizobium sp.]|nr:hypothetical protein [Rhizobium sp.]